MDILRRLGGRCVLVAGMLAVGLSGTIADPVAAECQGPAPSFLDRAPKAARVLIADVIDADPGGPFEVAAGGASSRLTLRVVDVLRGDAGDVIQVSDLPTWFCTGDAIVGRVGDRLAIAFDVGFVGILTRGNVEAWIRGDPAYEWSETTTTAAVYRLLGLRPPDTSTVGQPSATSSILPLGLVVAAALGLGLGWWMGGGRNKGPGIEAPVGPGVGDGRIDDGGMIPRT